MHHLPTSSTALTILAHVILLLCQCDTNLIITLGQRESSSAIWCIMGRYQKHCGHPLLCQKCDYQINQSSYTHNATYQNVP